MVYNKLMIYDILIPLHANHFYVGIYHVLGKATKLYLGHPP